SLDSRPRLVNRWGLLRSCGACPAGAASLVCPFSHDLPTCQPSLSPVPVVNDLIGTVKEPPFCETSAGSTFASLVHREKKAGFSEAPRHPAIDLLDTRWQQRHNARRVRAGTVTITGSPPPSRWSFCAQGHRMLSHYQASYPAILDIATYLGSRQ